MNLKNRIKKLEEREGGDSGGIVMSWVGKELTSEQKARLAKGAVHMLFEEVTDPSMIQKDA